MPALFTLFILLPILYVLEGFIMVLLWSWFVVPTFAVTEISIPCAIGLSAVLQLFANTTYLKSGMREGDEELTWQLVGRFVKRTVLELGVVLGVAVIVKQFM